MEDITFIQQELWDNSSISSQPVSHAHTKTISLTVSSENGGEFSDWKRLEEG